jgi:hypothetical protein
MKNQMIVTPYNPPEKKKAIKPLCAEMAVRHKRALRQLLDDGDLTKALRSCEGWRMTWTVCSGNIFPTSNARHVLASTKVYSGLVASAASSAVGHRAGRQRPVLMVNASTGQVFPITPVHYPRRKMHRNYGGKSMSVTGNGMTKDDSRNE